MDANMIEILLHVQQSSIMMVAFCELLQQSLRHLREPWLLRPHLLDAPPASFGSTKL